MSAEIRNDRSEHPTKAVVSDSNDSLHMDDDEIREDFSIKREELTDERENEGGYAYKKRSSPARSKANKKGLGRLPYPKMANRAPFPMVQRGHPYGAPPPYGYPGMAYGPPPGPYHPVHHIPMGPPYGGAPYPGPPAMKGYHHHHHHHHPHPPPPYGPHYGMPPSFVHHTTGMPPSYPPMSAPSDSMSISSHKSNMSSKKKRTIDGVHSNSLPSAYSFRRTDSSGSTTSTITAGNNTSADSNHTEESPHKRERQEEDVPGLSMDNLMFEDSSSHHTAQESRSKPGNQRRYHRRNFSGTSTASSLSVGGCSLASYEGPRAGITEEVSMTDASKATSKRQKKVDRAPLVVDTGMRPPSTSSHSVDPEQSTRFEQLSIEAKVPTSTSSTSSAGNERNIFLSLSTSPINAQPDVDATPISKNTTKKEDDKILQNRNAIFKPKPGLAQLKEESDPHRPSDTPTPPVHGELGDSEVMNDDHNMLNTHLRGQSFTPLPHIGKSDTATSSPTNSALASAIAPQLSWSIAGDTPSLGDLAEWEEEHGKLKTESKPRPGSTSSAETRNMSISPHDFHMWKDEHEFADQVMSGTTTPLPVFFDQSTGEGSENNIRYDHHSKRYGHHGESERIHPMISSNNCSNPPTIKCSNKFDHSHMWSKQEPMQDKHCMGMPPTPMYSAPDYRDDAYGRSPLHGDRRESMEFFPSYHHSAAHGGPTDRIRNLRGRVHHGAHFPPMPLHIPPPMASHLPMTSPMGLGPGKAGLWSPHHGGMPPPMGSPHHLGSPLNSMSQSKRKCVPLKPPIPSKFQGDMEKVKNAQVPEFTSLVNFPSHMSQKQSVNLPEGMRCCVMCGQACPCSAGGKGKQKVKVPSKPGDGGLVPRSSNGQDHLGDKNTGYAIIPTQNKGLCTLCDVNVWVVVSTGLEIKWCKGCKNFRPWAAFGDKGLATKCLRCRDRQREKYALQKEEKEKARMVQKPKK